MGYTNAGKSSMLNLLSHASVLARDQLFSTLDPVTRRVFLADGSQVLMTDTVGFIQKLPTGLVAAFRATLEELEEAAVLLHVVDISHPNAPEQVEVVEGIFAISAMTRSRECSRSTRSICWTRAWTSRSSHRSAGRRPY